MLIPRTKVASALSKVSEIRHIYKLRYLAADASERSVNNLLDLCRAYLEKQIDLFVHSDSAFNHKVWSFVIVKDFGYEICTLNDLNNCWKRFVLCKELFHIILDCESDRNASLEEHLDNFFGGITELEAKVSGSAQAEILAEIAAMEFLFPYVDRLKMIQHNIEFSDVAERYKIPRYFAERYMTKQYVEKLKVTG
jgi:hypothetical protein